MPIRVVTREVRYIHEISLTLEHSMPISSPAAPGLTGKEFEPLHLGSQGSHHQHEGASNGVGSKGYLKPKNGFGGFGGLAYKMK